jgi:uncharacterized protein (UPF0218 family)
MPTGSSPSEFAEFSGRDLALPEALREELGRPIGTLVRGAEVVAAVKGARPLVSVGDYTTADLVERGIVPQIAVVDFKTNRIEEPRWHTKLKGVGDWVVVIDNPAGTIRKEVWPVISEAFKSKERVRLEVRGEEDLLALVCIALAPEGGIVVYGQPGEGAVVVRVDRQARTRVLDILRRMVT